MRREGKRAKVQQGQPGQGTVRTGRWQPRPEPHPRLAGVEGRTAEEQRDLKWDFVVVQARRKGIRAGLLGRSAALRRRAVVVVVLLRRTLGGRLGPVLTVTTAAAGGSATFVATTAAVVFTAQKLEFLVQKLDKSF